MPDLRILNFKICLHRKGIFKDHTVQGSASHSHRMPCQMCFNSSVNAFDLDFGNEEDLAKPIKHWIPIIVL